MVVELCVDSFESALLAKEYNAKRIELCSGLSVGGLSPSVSLIKKCVALDGIETHVIVRPREGDFDYNSDEFEVILNDIEFFSSIGVDGVVFGCLNRFNEINVDQLKQVADVAKKNKIEFTFHRAFDFVEKPIKMLELLIDYGVSRVLTSGLAVNVSLGINLISKLVHRSSGRIEIMAGCGVNSDNALLLAESGVDALHFTSHKLESFTNDMGSKSHSDPLKVASITKLVDKIN